MGAEYCSGGELFDKIVKSPYSERDAAVLLRQLFEALAYLHKNGVRHRFSALMLDPFCAALTLRVVCGVVWCGVV